MVRNGRPHPPHSVDEFKLYPEAAAACRRLHALGLVLVIVTNQPDVARGELDVEVVEAIHRELRRHVPIDGLYVCLHDDSDRCGCRKPAPGLLTAAAADLELELGHSFMVGDRWRDVEAGKRAGCRTVHIDRGYREQLARGADFVAPSLAEAVLWIGTVMVAEGVAGGRG